MNTMRLAMLGLLVVGAPVLAQGQPNSAQYHAVHNPNSPHYVGQDHQPAAPPARWADRWGAIASDGRGNFGAVTDVASERRARKAALTDCKNRGGADCRVRMSYHNQCIAVASGTTQSRNNSAATEEKAIAAATRHCEAVDGQGACHIYYSACSLPVRVQ